MKRFSILGSTGSVGTQTLDIIREYRQEFELIGLVARRSSEKLLKQAIEFRPKYVVSYEKPTEEWLNALPEGTLYLHGEEGLMAVLEESQEILNAISGVDGILPTYHILTMGKKLLASNKESVVCLPDLIRKNREKVVPVDSEHNALFQLLQMVRKEHIKKVYLTASGGPFKDLPVEDLEKVTVEETLRHPRWKMGSKITVDSATLMNKGIEVLEAMTLFDLDLDHIRVVIHPQSYVHGALQLIDGSFIFHVSDTDMRIPVLHALFYPERKPFPFEGKEIIDLSNITFEEVDRKKFPALDLCKWVAQMGGVYVPVLIGADEAAVELFLKGRIKFTQIHLVVEEVLSSVTFKDPENIEDLLKVIDWAYHKGLAVGEKLA
ncbi:1-deoxy-D-xylulose-5-phosphate reductoisomerase [Thermocrinis minervae]|uniref:1-deoxy-D-xylulose 5-phosphate reductoisomerase n=1 Tax=Thermocrinis minervae TaxID=381751 RepID=A0A1M6R1G6_9AQUI|nr:1-deoxy-D-xylulose-5-phosphate reductoisomerase [Thermocrinis minervae]SHK26341.1 1-deoxy-D-xylulose 5-phosphate reductoisomerase [Thermocrinis minervae]